MDWFKNWVKAREEREAEKRRFADEQRRLQQEREAEKRRLADEQHRLQQEREARIKLIGDPAKFISLSDEEFKELGQLLVNKFEPLISSAGMKLISLILDKNGILAKVEIDFQTPGSLVSPHEQRYTAKGKPVKGRRKKDNEIIEEYLKNHVASSLLASSRRIFSSGRVIHPLFTKILVSCFTWMIDEYGNFVRACFLSCIIERELLFKLNLDNLGTMNALTKFQYQLGQVTNGRFKEIEPIEVKPNQKPNLSQYVSIADLKQLSPPEFEKFIGELYQKMGYNTSVTVRSNDGGIDVIAELEGNRVLIQCKRFKDSSVGVHAVRELYGVVTAENAKKGIIICTSDFTSDARRFAARIPIELIDGKTLEGLVRRYL